MEHVAKIVPMLWDLFGKNKKCKMNVTTKENEIIISIWSGRRWKRYSGNDLTQVITGLRSKLCLH